MPRRRPDPDHRTNGHDLTLPGATWERVDGYRECVACKRECVRAARRRRKKLRPQPRTVPQRPRVKDPVRDVDAYLREQVARENAPAWEKERLMWREDDQQHRRNR
jgi:hypothetical protein